MKRLACILCLSVILAVGACDGGSKKGDEPDAATHQLPDASNPQPDASTNGCDQQGFTAGVQGASTFQSAGQLYQAMTSSTPPYDNMQVQIYPGSPYNGPEAPGSYDLTGSNFETCGLCMLIFTGCDGQECEKTFYADTGSVNISSIGGLGATFAATFDNVIFREVTIDWSSYVSTPVPGGETWCMDGYSFSETVVDENATLCGEADINCVGETLPDFQLQNCETEQFVGSHDMAAGSKALWIVGTHVWCPACADWLPQVMTAYNQDHANGLNVAFVVGEDANHAQIDLAECRAYAAQYAQDASLFYIDHDGQYSHATTFDNLYPYPSSDNTLGFPWNAVMNGQTYEYEYADGAGGDLQTTLNQLLQ